MKKLNKKFIYGTGSAMIIAGACIIIILLNILASLLTDKAGLKIDVTETRYLDFTHEFEEFVESIDKEVDVYYLVNPNEVTRIVDNADDKNVVGNVVTTNFRLMMKEVFEKIERKNSKIHFDIIDPELNPEIVKDFGTVQIDDIVFTSGKNINSFNMGEILYYDDVGRKIIDYESKLASMFSSVMRDSKANVAFVTGHGEADVSNIKKIFDDEGVSYKDINLITDGISDEFNVLFIYGPTADFSVEEINIIEKFLSSGKNMQLYLDRVSECSNLVEYMSTLGIKYSPGFVVEKGENRYTIINSNYCIIPQTMKHSIINSLKNYILIPNTVSVEPMWESKNSIDGYPLLYTSNQTIDTVNVNNETSRCLVSISSRITESSIISNVIAGGSSLMYSDSVIEYNRPFLINSTLWMGRMEESGDFEAKVVSNEPLQLTQGQMNMWFGILVLFIPFVVIIAGFIVWIKRRYL